MVILSAIGDICEDATLTTHEMDPRLGWRVRRVADREGGVASGLPLYHTD